MESLHQLEVIIMLLAVVLALTTIAQKIRIPYPIFLVLGGLALGLVPGLPAVILHPDLVFLVFLPPILWAAAYFTSLREFRQNLRPISLLAVGLVLATSAGVAFVAHALLPGIGWAEAIALGAIVSPPDAVSATAIGKRLRIPRRIVTILEGESLVNDATALVLYRAAVGAAMSGSFALGHTLFEFVFAALAGGVIGIGVAWLTRWALCATEDGFTQIGVTLLAPYIAWVCGESVHASAVLACVAGGLYLRQSFSGAVSPATRLQARGVGSPDFCPEWSHFYPDRPAVGRVTRFGAAGPVRPGAHCRGLGERDRYPGSASVGAVGRSHPAMVEREITCT